MAPDPAEECFVFATFRLLPRQRTLLRGADVVAIGGRAFDLLLLLVSRAGVVISVAELMEIVWPAVTVEEANLRVQMGMLRKILSRCEAATRAIETIPLRGYCFILPVRYHPKEAEPVERQVAPRAQPPALLNPPIGRDEAIAIVAEALDERRLVTITGAGGIGKTTVAIATANRYAVGHAGAIGFVDLSHAADGEGAVSAIVDALGIDAPQGALDALCETLHAREMLLILDTCEHLVDPMAGIVETLLARCANLKLLLTSREALRAAGEWTHRLSSLRFPAEGETLSSDTIEEFPAVALFIERIRASMRFSIAEPDLALLSEICRRLDGIPLALEFAAARVADLGLREIAAHLDDRFDILIRGRRTALPRHRTLAAAFDWSYGLLGDEEQLMLKHLAGIAGAFSTEGAIALGRRAGCRQPAEALVGLYEKSLLNIDTRDDAPIYRVLDTTRAYVSGRGEEIVCPAELVASQALRVA